MFRRGATGSPLTPEGMETAVKDTLFLLKPGFLDGSSRFFCGECAMVEGMLSFYPPLREKLDVRYVGYARPRSDVIALVGEENQGVPLLVLGDRERMKGAPPSIEWGEADGRTFIQHPFQICEYLAARYGADRPH
ncbi:MAG TPA: DUF3088 domain-containing protein [Candidatus Thermoplasmatota archaeon]|nr:DUF3088 domain-containing protein [Candidatus Thermoplasmatota archaeon]